MSEQFREVHVFQNKTKMNQSPVLSASTESCLFLLFLRLLFQRGAYALAVLPHAHAHIEVEYLGDDVPFLLTAWK